MAATEVKIKQEVQDPEFDADSKSTASFGEISPTAIGILPSSQIVQHPALGSDPSFSKNITYLNGMIGQQVLPPGFPSPVLVVPQPYQHFLPTYYRPQFPSTNSPSTTPQQQSQASLQQALDLSKGSTALKSPPPEEKEQDSNVPSIPYTAKERRKAQDIPAVDEDSLDNQYDDDDLDKDGKEARIRHTGNS